MRDLVSENDGKLLVTGGENDNISNFSIRGLNPDQAISELNHSVPLGRIADPEDIADVILFLASDQARYICGALVEVNGGKPVS